MCSLLSSQLRSLEDVSHYLSQVGSMFGVALLEGQKGLNWGVFMKVVVGFLLTTVCCSLLASLFFSQAIFAPTIAEGDAHD